MPADSPTKPGLPARLVTRTGNSLKSVPRIELLALLAMVAFGVGMRVWILSGPLGGADADESVVGLMANAIQHGHPSVYFWGQAYGGSQEAIISAFFFTIFGTGELSLKLTPMALSVVAAWLLWRIGKQTVGDKAARWAAVLFWSTPFSFMWITTKERGFYEFTMVCGLAVWLCALKLAERDNKNVAMALGFAAGLGVWSSPQTAYLLLPGVAWIVVKRWRVLRMLTFAIPAFVVGAAPAILFNLIHSGPSFDIPKSPVAGTYSSRLHGFFSTGLPMFLGLRVPYNANWAVPGGVGIFAVLTVAFVVGVIWAIKTDRHVKGILLLGGTVVAYPFIFAISPWSAYVREPRYIYFFAAPATLLMAWVLVRIRLQYLWSFTAGALCVVSMVSLLHYPTRFSNHDLASDDIGPLITSLEQSHQTHVYADYWLAYRLTLDSRHKIIATPITQEREPSLGEQVDDYPGNSTYVVYTKSNAGDRLPIMLQQRKVSATSRVVGRVTVYSIEQKLPRTALDVPGLAN